MKKLLIILSAIILAAALSSCADHVGDADLTETQESTTAVGVAMARIMPEAEPGVIAYDMGIPAYGGTETAGITLLDRNSAIEIALSYAELSPADVNHIEAELEDEPAGTFWDVEFDHNGYEHSYFIDAESGEIVRSNVELND